MLNILAHSYRESGDTQNALKYFQMIIEQNPDTRRASSAKAYIDAINSGQDILNEDSGTSSEDQQDNGEANTGEENSGDNYEE